MRLLSRILILASFASFAVTASSASYWQDSDEFALRTDQTVMAKASAARNLDANIEFITQQLLNSDNSDIELPLPNGDTAIYHLEYSPIAEQGLLDQFPDIRTFRGVDVADSANRGRFDISPAGFRAMFHHNGETIFIDPQYVGNAEHYISYRAKDAVPLESRPVDHVMYTDLLDSAQRAANRDLAKGSSDGNLRTYRLAVAATGEYTQFFGGTVSDGIAAITTAINRVNEVYENDLAIRLVLIANNSSIVYTDPGTDPYANDGFGDLSLNQTNINSVIGSANYDIGHLFGTGTGGVATLRSVCDNSIKARGLTGLNNPTSDVFYIDFVAHEIGHQFGANHTFNGTTDSCAGSNRNGSTAYEPGSGSTIMAYAGICGSENLQNNSDAYFHAGSIAEITAFIQNGSTGGSCAGLTAPANSTPNANAGSDVTIPANTPFVLTGSATDVDGDTLSYTWEQMDAGTSTSSQSQWVDNGSRTIFRSIEPGSSPIRYFPNLPDVLDGSITAGEAFPTTNRNLNFRFTVRDGNGETAFENKVVSVTTSAGPFEVTSPNSGDTWNQGSADVTWDVADTNSAPVSCTTVDILYSDDGSNFTTALASSVANDGRQTISVPTNTTSSARVMVSCVNNVFYAVSNGDFRVSSSSAPNSSDPDSSSGGGGSGGAQGFPLIALLMMLLFRGKKRVMLI
ncbi:MAG: reprolysin-like metallopeptidase [Cellvibrionaceae bacterium]